MALRRTKYPIAGSGKQVFATTLFRIGADIAAGESRSRYSSQVAQAEVSILQSQEVLDQRLFDERDTSKWPAIHDEEWTKRVSNATEGLSGPALRFVENKLAVEKQRSINSLGKRARQQETDNNIDNINAFRKESMKPKAFGDEVELGNHLIQFNLTMSPALQSGDIPDLQTSSQYMEEQERFFSFHISNFLRQHPDKVDDGKVSEDYYIDHPNEFVKKHGFDQYFESPLFGPDEEAQLKKDNAENKRFAKAQSKIAMENQIVDYSMQARQYSMEGEFGLAKDKINEGFNQTMSSDLSQEEKQILLDWHTNALNKLQNANNILFSTGTNVYTTTQNPKLFDQLRRRVGLGEHISDTEMVGHVGEDGISWPDHDKIIGVRDGKLSKAKALEDSAAGQTLIEFIEGIPEGEERYDSEGLLLSAVTKNVKNFAEKIGLRWLEDAIKNNPEWTIRQKDEEAIRIFNRVNRMIQAGEIEIKAEQLPGYEKQRITGKDFDKIDISKLPKTTKEPTQNEFTQNVATLKRQGKAKEAREYYDKWVGKLWQ